MTGREGKGKRGVGADLLKGLDGLLEFAPLNVEATSPVRNVAAVRHNEQRSIKCIQRLLIVIRCEVNHSRLREERRHVSDERNVEIQRVGDEPRGSG